METLVSIFEDSAELKEFEASAKDSERPINLLTLFSSSTNRASENFHIQSTFSTRSCPSSSLITGVSPPSDGTSVSPNAEQVGLISSQAPSSPDIGN